MQASVAPLIGCQNIRGLRRSPPSKSPVRCPLLGHMIVTGIMVGVFLAVLESEVLKILSLIVLIASSGRRP